GETPADGRAPRRRLPDWRAWSGTARAAARGLPDRTARAWRFLVGRAREAGVPWPRAFVGAGLLLVAALGTLLVAAQPVHAPRPPAPEIALDLERAEALLARGELESARAALQQLLAA